MFVIAILPIEYSELLCLVKGYDKFQEYVSFKDCLWLSVTVKGLVSSIKPVTGTVLLLKTNLIIPQFMF